MKNQKILQCPVKNHLDMSKDERLKAYTDTVNKSVPKVDSHINKIADPILLSQIILDVIDRYPENFEDTTIVDFNVDADWSSTVTIDGHYLTRSLEDNTGPFIFDLGGIKGRVRISNVTQDGGHGDMSEINHVYRFEFHDLNIKPAFLLVSGTYSSWDSDSWNSIKVVEPVTVSRVDFAEYNYKGDLQLAHISCVTDIKSLKVLSDIEGF